MLPSTCLQKVEEQPEDADNQRNVTRMGSQPSDPSTTVHVPVTLTGPPGETTVAPSEYLPVPMAGPAPPVPAAPCQWLGVQLASLNFLPDGEKVLCYRYLTLISLGFPLPFRQVDVRYLCPSS